MSVINSSSFMRLLLVHLVRCVPVIEKASMLLQPDDFNRAGEKPARLLWTIANDFYKKERRSIPQDILIMEVTAAISDSQDFLPSEIEAMVTEITAIYLYPEADFCPVSMLDYLQLFLDERRIRPMLASAAIMDVGADLNQVLKDMQDVKAQTGITRVTELKLLVNGEGIFVDNKRIPTNVEFVDELLAGGTMAGEIYALMGPTGGGKTTIGSMLVSEIARQKRHVGFFSYETELAPQVTSKIYGYVGNIPRNALKVKNWAELPTAYRDSLRMNLGVSSDYMHLCDMKKDIAHGTGGGGVPELVNILREFDNKGQHIEVVIIDQLLSMVTSYMIKHGINLNERRLYLQAAVEELRDAVQTSQCNCCLFLIHQVDNVVKRASPMRLPRKGDSAEIKDIENNMQFCLQLGTKDKRNLCYFCPPKAREGDDNLALIIQLSQTHWLFTWDPKRYEPGPEGFRDMQAERSSRDLNTVKDIEKKEAEMLPEDMQYAKY